MEMPLPIGADMVMHSQVVPDEDAFGTEVVDNDRLAHIVYVLSAFRSLMSDLLVSRLDLAYALATSHEFHVTARIYILRNTESKRKLLAASSSCGAILKEQNWNYKLPSSDGRCTEVILKPAITQEQVYVVADLQMNSVTIEIQMSEVYFQSF
ncbi:hypothetical protein L7F22_048813 [Adiantum nelumboides]|nr:hypothetical protein [Adiantum nelumboides]